MELMQRCGCDVTAMFIFAGAMAGLAIGMIILGLIMGLACLVVYNKFFTGQSSSDGMAISFSKHENAE